MHWPVVTDVRGTAKNRTPYDYWKRSNEKYWRRAIQC